MLFGLLYTDEYIDILHWLLSFSIRKSINKSKLLLY